MYETELQEGKSEPSHELVEAKQRIEELEQEASEAKQRIEEVEVQVPRADHGGDRRADRRRRHGGVRPATEARHRRLDERGGTAHLWAPF